MVPNTITNALTTLNLTAGYRGPQQVRLFENLNLVLHPGELVCFMGPNGIGKSTLLRTLAGLQPPLSGEIVFPNVPGTQRKENYVSVVLTDRIRTSHLTVYELISFGRYPYLDWTINLSNRDKDIIDRSIAQVNIESLTDKKIDELSDGQMQMVMIARALSQDTPVLLLDEPTAHLDLNNRVEIVNLLRKLSATTGKAILMTTHELELALQTADVVWLATQDKIIKIGAPEDLVLDGSFDRVFNFKGYDLRTGKMGQEAHRGISIHLVGEGPEYVWTKNALERSGFFVLNNGNVEVVIKKENELAWCLSGHPDFKTLASLIAELKKK